MTPTPKVVAKGGLFTVGDEVVGSYTVLPDWAGVVAIVRGEGKTFPTLPAAKAFAARALAREAAQ
jgi:hypothetical protein